jgi:DNA-binding transcriptional LysR family regulator
LHLSQPALSRQIRDLECELGFSLFERTARSLRLTEAGRVFLVETRAVLQRAEDAVSMAKSVALGERGELHVGYAPSPTGRILGPTLRAFETRGGHVQVRLHDLSTEEMLSGLREGRLQIAFMAKPSRRLLQGLHFEELTRDPMRLAVPPGHSFAQLRSVPVRQAAKERLLAFSRKDYPEYYEYLTALLASAGVSSQIAEEHDSAASLVAAVEAGRGVAVVTETISCFSGSRLKLIPLSPAPEPLVIGAAWRKEGLVPAAKHFWLAARELEKVSFPSRPVP